MRGTVSYLVAGVLLVLTLDLIAPPAGLGFAFGAWPTVKSRPMQTVNRADKGDRLAIPAAGKRQAPQHRPVRLVGCEPVFSPLSASAQANFSGRCVS